MKTRKIIVVNEDTEAFDNVEYQFLNTSQLLDGKLIRRTDLVTILN